jgi:plastocyanin
VDEKMNLTYAVIAIVGVLAAISLGFIAIDPDYIPEPRVVDVTASIIDIDESKTMEKDEGPIACTMQYDPQCGVDGETYGNLCMLDAADAKLDYSGECVVPEPEVVEEVAEPEAAPMNAIVVIPPGAAVPGCENINECYLPYGVSVSTGATVMWSNDDSAPHTVSSGTVDAGLTGVFDSGLFMAGDSFEFTFDTPGTYDYFCMVHPWMTGIVSVS